MEPSGETESKKSQVEEKSNKAVRHTKFTETDQKENCVESKRKKKSSEQLYLYGMKLRKVGKRSQEAIRNKDKKHEDTRRRRERQEKRERTGVTKETARIQGCEQQGTQDEERDKLVP